MISPLMTRVDPLGVMLESKRGPKAKRVSFWVGARSFVIKNNGGEVVELIRSLLPLPKPTTFTGNGLSLSLSQIPNRGVKPFRR